MNPKKPGLTEPTCPGVITSTDSDDCYMPCDEQGVWIGPRGDASDAAEDPSVALKRFEDELAEFERLGEERWAAGGNEAVVEVSLPSRPRHWVAADTDMFSQQSENVQTRGSKARTAKSARRAERRARAA